MASFGNTGQLDLLVNAVGGYAGGVKFWDLESSVFDQMLELNRSGYVLSRAAAQVTGAIVNVAGKAEVDHAAGAAACVESCGDRDDRFLRRRSEG